MPRRFVLASLVLAGALLLAGPLNAARDFTSLFGGITGSTPAVRYELVVFEREACGVCEMFRQNIGPRYRDGSYAKTMPMRFVDIDKADTDNAGLKYRLTMLPTAVVMKDGAEVDRVPGLTAPETFFTLIQHILARAD